MKLIYSQESFGADEKRFYIPGAIIEHKCTCGKTITYDMEEHYLSYPTVNGNNKIHIYCDDCGTETPCTLRLDLMLTLSK